MRGDELPAEWRRREDRLAAIRAAKSRLEAQQRAADDARGRQPDQDRNPKGGQPYKRSYGEPDAKAQSNFTDPESGIMKTSNDGFQQCYNAQVAVDGAHQLVVATEVTANASDQGGVPALLDALAETVGEQPETVLADAGYSNERDLADLETRGIDGDVSLGREGKAARPRDPEKYPATSRMAEKLSRPAGRAAYAERKWLSEAPNGWIKHVLGFRRFSLRGLAKVQGEWDLVCLALNTSACTPCWRRNTRGMRLATTTDRRASARWRARRPSRPNLAICFALRRGAPSSADRRSRSGTMTHSMGRRPISRRRTSCGADS